MAWLVKCEDLEAQLATLQAQLAEERRNVVSMKQWGLDRVAEKNAEIEGYIIQVRTLTESIAMTKDDYKKWKAAEAQLRQVEGERDTARHRVDELEAREIDVEILQGDLTTLRQFGEDARRYRRLQVLGCAPSTSKQLENGTVLCFTNLDEFVDADLKAVPSRGEAAQDAGREG